jgi:hypothetical protein
MLWWRDTSPRLPDQGSTVPTPKPPAANNRLLDALPGRDRQHLLQRVALAQACQQAEHHQQRETAAAQHGQCRHELPGNEPECAQYLEQSCHDPEPAQSEPVEILPHPPGEQTPDAERQEHDDRQNVCDQVDWGHVRFPTTAP